MARPRTPSSILDARGSFIQHPERTRDGEPTDDSTLGNPPKYLSKEEKKVWKELSSELLPGVAKRSDRTAFATLVKLATKQRLGTLTLSAERTQLIALCGQFAMTPASRSKVSVQAPKKSGLQAFLDKQKQMQSQPVPVMPVPAPSTLPS